MPDPKPLLTPDGSHTAWNKRFGEAYGSKHGAASQAQHVFVQGSGTDQHPQPRVLEIGFGVGVNLRATLTSVRAREVPLHYLAYEFDPVSSATLRAVAARDQGYDHPAWEQLLSVWDEGCTKGELEVTDGRVTIELRFQNVLEADLTRAWASALYLDGFSPSRNPELWTPELLERLALALAPGGVLTTYSAAGHVRRALAACGLQVERRPGAPGKRECLRAKKADG